MCNQEPLGFKPAPVLTKYRCAACNKQLASDDIVETDHHNIFCTACAGRCIVRPDIERGIDMTNNQIMAHYLKLRINTEDIKDNLVKMLRSMAKRSEKHPFDDNELGDLVSQDINIACRCMDRLYAECDRMVNKFGRMAASESKDK